MIIFHRNHVVISGKRYSGEIKTQIYSTQAQLSECDIKTSGGTVIYHGTLII